MRAKYLKYLVPYYWIGILHVLIRDRKQKFSLHASLNFRSFHDTNFLDQSCVIVSATKLRDQIFGKDTWGAYRVSVHAQVAGCTIRTGVGGTSVWKKQ